MSGQDELYVKRVEVIFKRIERAFLLILIHKTPHNIDNVIFIFSCFFNREFVSLDRKNILFISDNKRRVS